MKNNLRAILWAMVHVIAAVIINVNYRLLSDGLGKIYIPTLYSGFAIILMVPYIIIFKRYIIRTKLWAVHIARAACYVIAQTLLVYAYNEMKFVKVSSIALTYPLISVIAAAIFLKEKIGISRITALFVGFIGAGVIINPSYGNFNIYSLAVLVAVILWVSFDILVKKFPMENIHTQFFYLMLFMALLSVFPAMFTSEPLPEIKTLLPFIPLGGLHIFYMLSALFAVMYTDSMGTIVPFYFTSLVIASVVGYCLFDELMSMRTVFGCFLIFGSTIYIAYREYKAHRLSKKQNIFAV